jgi:hypothetical protein
MPVGDDTARLNQQRFLGRGTPPAECFLLYYYSVETPAALCHFRLQVIRDTSSAPTSQAAGDFLQASLREATHVSPSDAVRQAVARQRAITE